jgi:serine/threonine protein kinase
MPRRLEPGQEVDGFRLEERMHQGGMAVLWRVTHPAQRLPLVMKVPLNGEGPGPIVGFEVEQMILPRLLGPHVPRFVAAADFSEQPYIVMERLPGESLLPFVENAPLQPAHVAEIGAKVAAALHDLHRQHVIHFDLKPSNVMTRESGEAVLIDYGPPGTTGCRTSLRRSSACRWGPHPTSRRSRCSPTAMILAATSSRSG